LEAVSAVIKATDERVKYLARKYATTGGWQDRDLVEDFEQAGRVAIWQSLARFEGEDVAQFFTFIDTTLRGTMARARRTETRPGVSEARAADFENALRACSGDPYEAQAFAASPAMGARKMTPEMAYAARLSWQGIEYLDAPTGGGEGEPTTLADRLGVTGDHATTYAEALDEIGDAERERRNAIRNRVHETLALMGGQQADVLRGTFGIEPVAYYGTENDAEMAADFGWKPAAVRPARAKGKARFAELWLKAAHLRKAERTCVRCEQTRPVSLFPVQRMNTDGTPGYRSECRDCHNAIKRERRTVAA
jgi:RNA polymerase sigma factor (sigma-70 family)